MTKKAGSNHDGGSEGGLAALERCLETVGLAQNLDLDV